jgi:hypothetical protein
MKPSTRLLFALLAIEAVLAALWWWLMDGLRTGTLTPAESAAASAEGVSTTIGGAMGAIGLAVLAGIIVLRAKGR